MKNMWCSIKAQLFYQWKAKYVILLFVILVVLSIFSSYAQYHSLQQKEERFDATLAMYQKDGITLKQALVEDLEVKKAGNSEEISNILKYDYYRVIAAKVALNPLNAPNQIFTSIAILFLPIIFGIYSCHVAFFDFKYGTYKSQLLLRGHRLFFFGKLLSVVIMAVGVVLFTVFLSMVVQYLFNAVMGVKADMRVNYLAELPLQVTYQAVVLILFGLFFFLLTVASRSTLISTVVLFIYMLLVPNLGGFDLKNLMLISISKIYNTSAATMDVVSGENTNLMLGYLVVVTVFGLLTFFVYRWDKQRLCPEI